MRYRIQYQELLSTIESSAKGLEFFLKTRPSNQRDQEDMARLMYQLHAAIDQAKTYINNEPEFNQ
jgi:hypothetical protein